MKATILCICIGLLATESTRAQEKLDLSVLYAGEKGHARTNQWVSFLKPRCRSVATIALSELSKETAKGADVVIVDSPSPYADGGVKIPRGPEPGLTRAFDKPVILLGAGGGATLRTVRIKLDWL